MRKRIAGTAAPSNALVSREFCVIKSFGKGASLNDGKCLGIAVSSETLVAPILFDGCEDAKIQDGNSFMCKSTNIKAQTDEGSTQGAAPKIATNCSAKLRVLSSPSMHTSDTACIDKLWHHSIFSPTDSHSKDAKLVDMLCTFAESFDSASDPFEPLPL